MEQKLFHLSNTSETLCIKYTYRESSSKGFCRSTFTPLSLRYHPQGYIIVTGNNISYILLTYDQK